MRLSFKGTGGNSSAVFFAFVGASDESTLEPLDQLPSVKNFLYGGGRARTGVRSYSRVAYRGLYEGVDLELYEGGSLIEYDIIVRPGSDIGRFIVECQGVDGLELASDGSLVMKTAVGPVTQSAPKTWIEDAAGERVAVCARFRLLGESRYGFEVDDYDRSKTLVVDPAFLFDSLQWSTYLGGQAGGVEENGDDKAWDVAVAQYGTASGQVTVVGGTAAIDFPTTPGLTTNLPGLDAFITRLNSSGSALIFSTYFGGSCNEHAHAVDLAWDPADSSKNPNWAAVTGTIINGPGCTPPPFPVATAFDVCPIKLTPASTDAFVLLLDQTGIARYFSFLGGEGNEEGWDIAVLPTTGVGVPIEVYVCGLTTPSPGGPGFCVPPAPPSWVNFPATGSAGGPPGVATGLQVSYQGGMTDAFVSKMSLGGAGAGDMLYSTYLGSPGEEQARAIVVNPHDGHCYVTGFTNNSAFPTALSAFQPGLAGQHDAFVSRINPFVSGPPSLVASTFLGGGQDGVEESGYGIVVQGPATGELVTVVGTTYSTLFPTPNGWDTTHNGSADVFVTRLEAGLGSLVWSTYLGGDEEDHGRGICIVPYPFGNNYRVTVVGYTASNNSGSNLPGDFPILPLTGPNAAYQTSNNGSWDVFVSQFGTNGALARSTFVGGEFSDVACGVSPDGQRDVVVCGWTSSQPVHNPPFPVTVGAVQTQFGGGTYDAFVFKIRASMTPMGQ